MNPTPPCLRSCSASSPTGSSPQREASPHTVASYRDTFRLLLAYASRQLARQPTDLSVADIDADLVAGFLAFVEDDRKNSIRTRNVRRAAIRGFFRFVAIREPALLLHCQRVLAIPAEAPDQTDGRLPRARGGRRTARDARPVHIDRPARPEPAACRPADRTAGLGADRSEHRRRGLRSLVPAACPVPRQGTQGSGDAAARRQRQGAGSVAPGTGPGAPHEPLFASNRKRRFSRDGIERIVRKYARLASATCPSLARKRVSPHTFAPLYRRPDYVGHDGTKGDSDPRLQVCWRASGPAYPT